MLFSEFVEGTGCKESEHNNDFKMVKFKFFVHCKGWKDGGYENTHFAETAKEARRIIKKWNDEYTAGSGAKVSLISITEISDREFAEDFIY